MTLLKSMALLLKNSYFAAVGKLLSDANLLAFFSDVHIQVAIQGLEPAIFLLVPLLLYAVWSPGQPGRNLMPLR
jgi:hypothetical protein